MIKILFFGSSEYSVIILKTLLTISDFNIIGVVTKQDKPVGRHQDIIPNPVASFAASNQLPLYQPTDFDTDFLKTFTNLKPDLVLVVAYGPPYFTQTMIDTPLYKIVNIHPSPLPKYRGATPGPWQIINGETTSAVTFFQIDALPDHGPIISQIPFSILDTYTSHNFYQKAFNLASQHLESVLKNYVSHPDLLHPQDHSQKSYYPKFTRETAKINWSWTDAKIDRFIRAMQNWPTAWTEVKNQKGQIFTMKVHSSYIEKGNLVLKLVQIAGKKPTLWNQISNYYSVIK